MAYDEFLADRISNQFNQRNTDFYTKKMFGGLCFMVDDKMCVGINDESLMLRIDPEKEEELRKKTGVRDMNFTGRPMKGYLYVDPEGIDSDESLRYFLDQALEFNPKAKSSKKKKK